MLIIQRVAAVGSVKKRKSGQAADLQSEHARGVGDGRDAREDDLGHEVKRHEAPLSGEH